MENKIDSGLQRIGAALVLAQKRAREEKDRADLCENLIRTLVNSNESMMQSIDETATSVSVSDQEWDLLQSILHDHPVPAASFSGRIILDEDSSLAGSIELPMDREITAQSQSVVQHGVDRISTVDISASCTRDASNDNSQDNIAVTSEDRRSIQHAAEESVRAHQAAAAEVENQYSNDCSHQNENNHTHRPKGSLKALRRYLKSQIRLYAKLFHRSLYSTSFQTVAGLMAGLILGGLLKDLNRSPHHIDTLLVSKDLQIKQLGDSVRKLQAQVAWNQYAASTLHLNAPMEPFVNMVQSHRTCATTTAVGFDVVSWLPSISVPVSV